MRKYLALMVLALSLSSLVGATDNDPVVMTVAGKDVGLSEFQYFIQRNEYADAKHELSVSDYAKMYVDYKMKVQAAVDEGFDTLQSFIDEFNSYREMEMYAYVYDTTYLDSVAHMSYEASVIEIGPSGLAFLKLIALEPDSTDYYSMERCAIFADSLYEAITLGADFSDIARRYSSDESASKGGSIGLVSRSMFPEYIADIIFGLNVGETSRPFFDNGTFFLAQVIDRHALGTYEQNEKSLYKWMYSQQDIVNQSKLRMAARYSDGTNWGLSDSDSIIKYMQDNLEMIVPEFLHASREYHDGLLLFDVLDREILSKPQTDVEGMKAFFNSNQKFFDYDVPRFRGMVFFCRSEEVFHEVEDLLSGHPVDEWAQLVLAYNGRDIKVRILRGKNGNGLFAKGQNEYVDKLVFNEGDFELMNGYPCTRVLGQKINRPETIDDDLVWVSDKYRSYLEKEWLKKLHKKYSYKINKKVLKQISF